MHHHHTSPLEGGTGGNEGVQAEKQPDWADLLAKAWVDQAREIFKNKGYDGSPGRPIVTTTATELIKPIDNAFGQAINYDSPDFVLREVLKQNIWDFSVAKNHQDNIALNNQLLDEEGKLRSWSDFKYEAQKIVGRSNRYLKTEYNTVVAGAQMSRLWRDIQRDKELFPFAQFMVTKDGHTSEICEPLYKVIVSVDDPMLAHYFPPNHFNCRTTVIKLRKGPATEDYTPPKIPEDFQNNAGDTGEIFTGKNAYLEKTPQSMTGENNKEALRHSRKEALRISKKRYSGKTYKIDEREFKITRKGLEHAISQNHDNYWVKNSLIKELEAIFKDAKYVTTSGDNKGRKQFIYHYYAVKGHDDMFIVLREVLNNGEVHFYTIVDHLQ